MKLLSKLFCKHKWQIIDKLDVISPSDGMLWRRDYLLVCKECGKIKKVKF